MLETCKSCGTMFEVDESMVTDNIQWFKCGVCNEKWILSSFLEKNSEIKIKSEKVKKELASIKSAVEDKSKILAKNHNRALEQKNKSVAEIASELSLSKVNENKNNIKKSSENNKKTLKKFKVVQVIIVVLLLIFCFALFFRSTLVSYGFLYFPTHLDNYAKKINDLLTRIELPITSDTKNLNLIDFIATLQDQDIKFTGIIKNISKRPILVPRIRVLAIREDRKIILEKILVLDEKIVSPKSNISFNKIVKVKIKEKKENVTVKATLLKKVFDYWKKSIIFSFEIMSWIDSISLIWYDLPL